MISLLKQTKAFIIPYILFLLLCIFPVILFSKTDLHLFINRFHHPAADHFFILITNMGHGIFALSIALLLLLFRFRYSVMMLISFIISGLLSQFFKRVVFPGFDRPVKFIGEDTGLYLVPGLEFHQSFSFPSGHAATAFAVFFLLSFFTKRKSVQLIFFLLALLTAFSRVYLSQHFLEDILAGSVIGIITSLLCYYYILKIEYKELDVSVIDKFRK